jgi:hypothetical protein
MKLVPSTMKMTPDNAGRYAAGDALPITALICGTGDSAA